MALQPPPVLSLLKIIKKVVHDVQNIPGNGNETQNQLITATQQPLSPVALSADVEMLLERFLGLFGGFCGRDSGIGPAQRAKTTICN